MSFAVPACASWCSLASDSVAWIIVGGVLQMAGFVLVAVDLARIQHREFGLPESLRRIQRLWRRLLRRPQVATIGTAEEINLVDELWLRQRRHRGQTLEDHVAALEINFQHLEKELDLHRERVEERLKGIQEELREAQAAWSRRQQEREQDDKMFLRTSIILQSLGIMLFVVGTSFSIIGSVVI
jgi:hypothetical protein